MAKTTKWSPPKPKKHFSIAELAEAAGVDKAVVRAEIEAGRLKCTDSKRQWIATEAGLAWLTRVQKEGPPVPIEEPEPDAAAVADNPQLAEILSPAQVKAMLDMDIPPALLKNAAAIERLSKTMLAVTQQNERALKVQTEAGRMVDVKDIEVFLDRIFGDWIAEIRALESTLDYRMAEETGVPIETVRKILTAASNHLITAGNNIAETTEARMDEFRRHHADRARRRVDGARRASVQ